MRFPRWRLSLSSRGLRIGFALLGGVFVSAPLVRCGSVHASAEIYPTALTSEQTLALFGTSIPALWYDGSAAQEVTFNYVGSTFGLYDDSADFGHDVYPPNGGTSDTLNSRGTIWYNGNVGWHGGNLYDDQNRDTVMFGNLSLHANDYLIYSWYPPSSIQAAGSFDFQLRFAHSIDITCNALSTSVFWTSTDVKRNLSTYQSFLSLYGVGGYGSDELKKAYGLRPSNSDFQEYYWRARIPAFKTGVLLSDGSPGYCLELEDAPPVSGCAICYGQFEDETITTTFGGMVCNIKNLYAGTYPTLVSFLEDSAGQLTNYTDPVVYIYVQCPVLYGDYTLPESGGGGSDEESSGNPVDVHVNVDVDVDVDTSGIESQLDEIIANQESELDILEDIHGDTSTHTTQLNTIIEQLNDIYAEMVERGEVTVNLDLDIDASLENQTNALVAGMNAVGQFVVNGVRDLFVPKQSDILNFKMDLEVLTQQTFTGVTDAQALRDATFERLTSVEAAATVDLPLIDLTAHDVNFAMDADTLRRNGLTVEDDKIKVELRPHEKEWHMFYELAALAIDIVVTIAVINMLLNKFHALLVGEKVVEVDGS